MHYVAATVILAFAGFINLLMAIIMSFTQKHLHAAIWEASNATNISSKVMPFLRGFESLMWILFIFSSLGAIVWYIIGSHSEEHETYRTPTNRY